MENTRLGNSDLVVSRVGLGGCPLGGHGWGQVDDTKLADAVRAALNAGIDFFDTADVYGLGRSETVLSQALGSKRHDVTIATKFGVRWNDQKQIVKDISRKYLREALEASLKRLRVDCIPLYYVHWPDHKTPVEEAIEELERCRRQGKVRAIGVSNFSSEQIRLARQVAEIASAQAQLSLVETDALSLETVLRETEISLTTWGSLAHGLLCGKYDIESRFGANDRRQRYDHFQGETFRRNLHIVESLKSIASRLGKTPAQVAIRWLLDTPAVSCVLFGAKSPQQVDDNFGAIGWSLPQEDYWQLASLCIPIPA